MKTGLLSLLLSFFLIPAFAQIGPLQAQIEQLTKGKKATVGVGIHDFASGQTLTINGDKHLPMQSVYKFHIALAVLREVDKGRFTLTQKLPIKKSDLLPNTHSPMRDAYPNGGVALPLADIIRYMVADSDNNACDYLLRLLGGPARVDAAIHQLGIRDVAIRTTEEVQQADWAVQYTNWTTQAAMLDLLRLFYQRKILAPSSHDFLWDVMAKATTGQNRLKKGVPAGTLVAHKTGTSGVNTDGLRGAINDAGFIQLPGGKHIAISVFVVNSTESTEVNERIIADVATLAYAFFTRLK